MATSQEMELCALWEDYLVAGNEARLSKFLHDHPEFQIECIHKYPELHRISDIVLQNRPYCILRCTACHERLTIRPIDPGLSRLDQPGVPYWLQGRALRYWVTREAIAPAKEAIDFLALKAKVDQSTDDQLDQELSNLKISQSKLYDLGDLAD